jgi:hypothetical protein
MKYASFGMPSNMVLAVLVCIQAPKRHPWEHQTEGILYIHRDLTLEKP